MKRYNLFYNNIRLNNFPLKKEDVDKIYESKVDNVKKNINGELITIPLNKINVIQVTIV